MAKHLLYMKKVKGSRESRYKHLGADQFKSEHGNTPMGHFNSANEALHMELGGANAIRVGRMTQKTNEYDKFRYALLGAFMECEDFPSFLPPPLLKQLFDNLDKQQSNHVLAGMEEKPFRLLEAAGAASGKS